MAVALQIDVYVDLICPWCLIGKRYLDEALTQFQDQAPDVNVAISWHSVQLLTDAPPEGWDFESFYLKRLGSAEAMRARQVQVNAAALSAGFQIDFSNIPLIPNTQQAHQLLNFASARLPEKSFAELLEHLFDAHFQQGANLGDRVTLCRIAEAHGLNASVLEAWIKAGAGRPSTTYVRGVPHFVFNRQVTLSGAQPPNILLNAMQRAISKSVQDTKSSAGHKVWQ